MSAQPYDKLVERNNAQAKRIKRMTAWLEKDRHEINAQAARIVALEAALEKIDALKGRNDVHYIVELIFSITRDVLKGGKP